ncbi:MAG: hypothetical protein LAT55_07575 [Opitutales bacterium]|nr:hypothetical protein [Opitutales bacterium]
MTEENQDWTPSKTKKTARKRTSPARKRADDRKPSETQAAKKAADPAKIPEPPPDVEVLPPAHFAAQYEPPKKNASGKGRSRNNRRGRSSAPSGPQAQPKSTEPQEKAVPVDLPVGKDDFSSYFRIRRPGVASLPQKHEVADAAELEKQGRRLGSAGNPLVLADLLQSNFKDLQKLGNQMQADLSRVSGEDWDGVLEAIFRVAMKAQQPLHAEGVLANQPDGFSFLVQPEQGFQARNVDPFVPLSVIRQNRLRSGQRIKVQIHPGERGQTCPYVLRVLAVMDKPVEKASEIVPFFQQKILKVTKGIALSTTKASRAKKKTVEVDPQVSLAQKIDYLAPLGFGQRILLTGEPHSGKADVLLALAGLVSKQSKKEKVRMLFVDSRPELIEKAKEIKGVEVYGTTFTDDPEMHLDLAANVLEYGERDAECGENVILLVDSLSKLERAQERKFERASANHRSGPLGVLPVEAYLRRFWSTGRALEGGGSLTLVATETTGVAGNKRDEFSQILQAMASSILFLDKTLRWKRHFPPLDVRQTYSHDEEVLLSAAKRKVISSLRRKMGSVDNEAAFEILDQELPNA